MAKLAEEHALDVKAEREPKLGFDSNWVQDHENQRALLDCFKGHLRGDESPHQSLCFIYAKKVRSSTITARAGY